MNEDWRRDGVIEGLLLALMMAMGPKDAPLAKIHDFQDYMDAREWGLALAELSAIVNGE